MFIEHWINILEWFLNGSCDTDTGVMTTGKSRNKLHFKIHKIEKKLFLINFLKSIIYSCLLI